MIIEAMAPSSISKEVSECEQTVREEKRRAELQNKNKRKNRLQL